MSRCDRLSHLSMVRGIVQVAHAAAIRAAEAWYGHESLSDSSCDAALQIQAGFADEYLLEAGMRQEVIDVPPSCCFDAFQYLDVAVHPLEAAKPSCRAGVRIEASGKVHNAQGSDHYLPCLRQRKYKCINSGLISLRLHASAQHGGYLSLMLYRGIVEEIYEWHIKARLF
jgi:hypothetical protein